MQQRGLTWASFSGGVHGRLRLAYSPGPARWNAVPRRTPDPGSPRCADPENLFSEYVTAVYVAGDNARSARGISGLLKAAAPLKGLKTIESKLAAEAARAMAKNQ